MPDEKEVVRGIDHSLEKGPKVRRREDCSRSSK